MTVPLRLYRLKRSPTKRLFSALLLIILSFFSCIRQNSVLNSPEATGPVEIPKFRVRLSFVGDVMAHRENYTMKRYSDIWTETAPLFLNDDFTFGNLEFVVDPAKPKSTFPRFNIDSDYVRAAAAAGLDVFSLANNHTADQGAVSMLATLGVMEELSKEFSKEIKGSRELYFSGIFRKREDYLIPVYWQRNGITCAFLAVTQFSNRGDGVRQMNLVSYKRSDQARKALIKAVNGAKEKADLVILSFHGGREYSTVPEAAKHDFFRQLLISGVDIIWAHHPHVLQPWKKYTVNGSDKLVMYSTGNFISGQGYYINPGNPRGRQYRGESGIYQVEVVKQGRSLEMDINTIPVVNYTHPERGIIVKLYDSLGKSELPDKWKNYYNSRKEELYSVLRIKK